MRARWRSIALPPDEARELAQPLLARARARAPLGDDAAAIADEAGGHPLFIDELVRHSARTATGAAPLRLDDALWARVARLERRRAQLLELVAVAGAPLAAGDRARRRRRRRLRPSSREQVALLRVAHLVRTAGQRGDDAIEPYHDRVREAVRGAPRRGDARAHATRGWRSRSRRRARRSRGAGDALARRRRARRARRSYAVAAADAGGAARSPSIAPRGSTAWRSSSAPRRRPSGALLRVKLGDALANAGRGAEAARGVPRRPRDGAAAARRSSCSGAPPSSCSARGHIDEGLEALAHVLGAVGMRLAGDAAAARSRRCCCGARGSACAGSRFTERDEAQIPAEDADAHRRLLVGGGRPRHRRHHPRRRLPTRHLLLALDAGEPYRVARALAIEGGTAAWSGGPGWPRATRLFADADALAREVAQPHAQGLLAAVQGVSSYFVGRWRAGLEQCRARRADPSRPLRRRGVRDRQCAALRDDESPLPRSSSR